MIWRDDDISADTRVEDLRAVDDIFQRYGVPHTIAIIAKDLATNGPLVDLIRERRMIPQLHCWTHKDLSVDAAARDALAGGAAVLAQLFGARPTVLYPTWNRTSPALEEAAARLGLTVSARKASLEQFIRCRGDVVQDTVNFHYWHAPDVAQLDEALRLEVARRRTMKVTDYCPRAAPFDTYLTGRALVGVEVGVDAGAHAQALLQHCDIASLTLIDRWPKEYHYGYCEGRLSALGFRPRFRMVQRPSLHAADQFTDASLDFVYIDQEHDPLTVEADLRVWWPKLRPGGVLGYRNYTARDTGLDRVVDAFVAARPQELVATKESGEIILRKCLPS